MCLWYQRVTNWPITETKLLKLCDQFIRISVEISANAPRFGIRKAGRTLDFENCSFNRHIGTFVNSQKPLVLPQRRTGGEDVDEI